MEYNPFAEIIKRLDSIERAISEIRLPKKITEQTVSRKILSIDEAAALTGLSKSRLYVLAGNGTIPNFKQGSRVRFYYDEVLSWLESGRRHSRHEIDAMADETLKQRKNY